MRESITAWPGSASRALDLVGRESQLIEEIDEASLRVDNGTYGQCDRGGKFFLELIIMLSLLSA